jgi:hypothetical protein
MSALEKKADVRFPDQLGALWPVNVVHRCYCRISIDPVISKNQ